jgi:hypothetical protein
MSAESLLLDEYSARIATLEEELRSARLLLGYVLMERGRDGEVMIGNGTLQRYDRFTFAREDNLRGGMLIRAIPA